MLSVNHFSSLVGLLVLRAGVPLVDTFVAGHLLRYLEMKGHSKAQGQTSQIRQPVRATPAPAAPRRPLPGHSVLRYHS